MTALLKAVRAGSPGSLCAAFLYFDVSFMVWVMIGALGIFIANDLGLTATQKGVLVGVPLLAAAVFRIIIGFLADRFGPKKIGLLTLAVLVVPLLWGWLGADRLRDVAALGVLLGVAGASFAVALPLASRWYPPEHQGLAMGIAGAGNSGSVLSVLFAPVLAESVGWHGVFGLALIPLVMTFLLFVLLAEEPPGRASPLTVRACLRVARRPELWWYILFYSFTFGGFVGLSSFLGILLHDQYGVTAAQAGRLAALCIFAGSFFRPFGGYLADRVGGMALLGWISIAVPCLLLAVGLMPPLGAAVLLIFFVMMGFGMGNGAIFQLVPQRFQDEIGIVTGVIGAAGGLGGFILPALLGWLKDGVGSYGAGLIVFGGAILLFMRLPLYWYGEEWRSWGLAAPGRSRQAPASVTPPAVPAGVATADVAVASPQIRMEVVFGG